MEFERHLCYEELNESILCSLRFMLLKLPGMHPIKIHKNTLYLTLNTMSTMHQVFTVTMTDTDFTSFGAFRISFFTYSVPKYPQPFCHRKNYIFINSNFIYKLFVITLMKVEFLDSTLVIINEKNYLRLHEIVEIKKL